MTVYVVEQGMYADQMVTGVYATLEAAKADNPRTNDEWQEHADGVWSADAPGDPGAYVSITPWNLKE